jgi:uncharacterized protein with HEPN domain
MKDNTVYIDHILSSIARIQEYISGMDLSTFLQDNKTHDAVVRQFEVIGEATKQISPEFRIKHPEIPWSDMAGMRDDLIHDYIDVNFEIVWKTATENMPLPKDSITNLK